MRVRFIVHLAESINAQISMKATEQVAEQVVEQVNRLLFCLKHKPLGSREAMQCLGLSHRPAFLYDYLKPLLLLRTLMTSRADGV
jgi:ATP-dependent DNA helicase RecG